MQLMSESVCSFVSRRCPEQQPLDAVHMRDPLGDGGSSVATGAAQLSVPAGTAHDLWANLRTVPRLLQAAQPHAAGLAVAGDARRLVTTRLAALVAMTPDGAVVAMITREQKIIPPRGSTRHSGVS